MYVYQITNNINGKQYIGITNNYKKRWENHRCNNDSTMAIAQAIKKYGVENFTFEILYSNLSIEEASLKEITLIKEKNTKVPNGYNVAEGGQYNIENRIHIGADNGKALLTQEEAQYIKDHRNLPMYVLYEDFSDKISYQAFKKCYKNQTYTNLIPKVEEYPYNTEFSTQFSGGRLEYDEILEVRQAYEDGKYWKDVYEKYKDRYTETSFWRLYTGLSYKLIRPEIFTEERKKFHASLKGQGKRNHNNSLTEDEVREIRRKHSDGVTNKELYAEYTKVSPTTIRDIINFKSWKNVL